MGSTPEPRVAGEQPAQTAEAGEAAHGAGCDCASAPEPARGTDASLASARETEVTPFTEPWTQTVRGTYRHWWTLMKAFHFSAAHQLHGMREGHPCARVHGHNYEVVLTLEGDMLDDRGILVDYGDLKDFGRLLDDCFDHRDLNEVMAPRNPTAENLAEWLFLLCTQPTGYPWAHLLRSVTIKETPKTSATYYREASDEDPEAILT